jgi:integrase
MPKKKEEPKKRKDGLIEKKVSLRDANGNVVKGANGKAITKHFYGKTERDIKRQVDKWQYGYWTGQIPLSTMPFSAFADKWLKGKEGSVAHSTYRSYRTKVEDAKKYFGDTPLSTIRQFDVQEFMSSLKGMSESTLLKYKIVLKSIFKLAITNDLIVKNPYNEIKMPQTDKTVERRFYTKEQARAIIDMAKKSKYGLGPFIQLKTGVRPGELLALNHERDFDLKNNIVNVRRAIKEGAGYLPIEGPTKTYQVRAIPVDKEFVDHIKSLNLSGYLFYANKGSPRRYEIYVKWFHNKFLEEVNMEIQKSEELQSLFGGNTDLTPYEYRHTYGTRAYQSGTDLLTLQRVMGHKTVEVTKIYIHHDEQTLKTNLKLDY